MGVECIIAIDADDAALARRAAEAAFSRIAALESVLSDYQHNSEINRITRSTAGVVHIISNDLAHALARSLELTHETNGAFDVTHGRVYHLWRAARRSGAIPTQEAIAEALAHGGWKHLQFDHAQREITCLIDNMQLDFGGIGKGFAADEAMIVLKQHGYPRALIDLGGDIAVGDPPRAQSGWRIVTENGEAHTLHNCGIATSGDTQQFMIVDGRRLSHIIDPRSGWPVANGKNVTVIAHDATTADARASAAAVHGAQ